MGTAAAGATVTVNDQRCHRAGEHFWIQLPIDNLADSVETNIVVYVVSNDVVASASGTLFVAKSTESVAHEATGAISAESRYSYAWGGDGRLTAITSTNASPNFKLEFTYYPDGQRATKKVSEWTGSEWSVVRSHSYVYDGWLLIWERVTNSTTSTVSTRHYTWGLDLQGRKDGRWAQQAGGIGGLLAITVSSSSTNSTTSTYLPISDHNGNIHHLLDTETKEIVANWTYSPFGQIVSEWICADLRPPASDLCSFRWHGHYYDRETELYYVNHRYFDPASTKFLSRDPIGEAGGDNQTSYGRNDPVKNVDPFGEKGLGVYADVKVKYAVVKWRVGNVLSGAILGSLLGQRMMDVDVISAWQALGNATGASVPYNSKQHLLIVAEVTPTGKMSPKHGRWRKEKIEKTGIMGHWKYDFALHPVPALYPLVSSRSTPIPGRNVRAGHYSFVWGEHATPAQFNPYAPGEYGFLQLWGPVSRGMVANEINPFTTSGHGFAHIGLSPTDPTTIGLFWNNPIHYMEIVPFEKNNARLKRYDIWIQMRYVPSEEDKPAILEDVFHSQIVVSE